MSHNKPSDGGPAPITSPDASLRRLIFSLFGRVLPHYFGHFRVTAEKSYLFSEFLKKMM